MPANLSVFPQPKSCLQAFLFCIGGKKHTKKQEEGTISTMTFDPQGQLEFASAKVRGQEI